MYINIWLKIQNLTMQNIKLEVKKMINNTNKQNNNPYRIHFDINSR